MPPNSCALQKLMTVILISVSFARENYIDAARWPQAASEIMPAYVTATANDVPPRLITAIPLVKEEWPLMTAAPQGSNRQKKLVVLPVNPAVSTSEELSLTQKTPREKVTSSKPVNIPLELKSTNISSPSTENTIETVKRITNATYKGMNKTGDLEKRLVESVPENPLDTIPGVSTTPNTSSADNGQLNRLLLSVQAVQGPYIPSANSSSSGGASNTTTNGSAVVISKTREIEVVIIAEKPPDRAPPKSTTGFHLSLASPAPSRRFPSSLLYQNGTFWGARRPLPQQYSARHYWAVYLTLTLLSLSVLAICVVCCTSQGRRDMSLPSPKPVQYGHQLPPYSYAFSHEMRQADSQEMARLNPSLP